MKSSLIQITRLSFFLLLLALVVGACQGPNSPRSDSQEVDAPSGDSSPVEQVAIIDDLDPSVDPKPAPMSALEKRLIDSGLVNVLNLDSSFIKDLRYSTSNNFLGVDIYEDYNEIYLQPDVAVKLVKAHKLLKLERPNHRLVIFDAVRPRSVQQKMWDILDVPPGDKPKYVSNPKNGSLHNFGAAVDLSIADSAGQLLDMGTAYDYFGVLAYPEKEIELLNSGELSQLQVDNRRLLRKIMVRAGFSILPTEWWHFNSCSRPEARERYSIIE